MEPDFREFEAGLSRIRSALEEYLHQCRSRARPVIRMEPIRELASRLQIERWIHDGGLLGPSFEEFLGSYLDNTTRVHHPGYMAHQVTVPHVAGSLGSLLDGFTNNPMAIYEMGPAAASIEFVLINWMLEKIGWPPTPWPSEGGGGGHGAGVLTHGGSLANLTALVAARNRVAPDVWHDGNPAKLAVLASPAAHYAVARAVGIMGLGHRAVFTLPVDRRGVIEPGKLEETYRHAVDEGWTLMALVANSCSTAVGLFDPLRPIAEFCGAHDLWLHVDGAHGASALLSPETRHHLDGIDGADSLVWDAHKLMRTPNLCAALLVRDAATLDGAFEQEASYIFHGKDQPGVDIIHRTVECTKAGLGLRLFFVLATLGEKKLGDYVAGTFSLARAAHRIVSSRPGFECAVEPEANIVCFRYGSDDDLQIRLRNLLLREGRFHISSTEFAGARYLRLALMNPDTDETILDEMLDRIEELAAAEEAS
jgi:L-2,4-diaminobutyrate decarboxylase